MSNTDTWKLYPLPIDNMDNDSTISHFIFMDESGDANMQHIVKSISNSTLIDEGARYFSLTSVIISKNDLPDIMDNFIKIKSQYWPDDGCYKYKNDEVMKVCFHSKEIRDQKGPFSKNCINYDSFINDLSFLMSNLPVSLCSCFIDKENHFRKYNTHAQHPYEVSLTFILERVMTKILKDSDQVIIILESRGKKEDKQVLNHLLNLINNGTYYVSYRQFQKISGVYFNKKRPINNNKLSYYGLEIADLCSHPIYRYCITGEKARDFNCIEEKIHGFPNIMGKGIKKFP